MNNNNEIQIIIPYSKDGINGKDFETYARIMCMLKYPVSIIVVGSFPSYIIDVLPDIKYWLWCEDEDIQKMINKVHYEMMNFI